MEMEETTPLPITKRETKKKWILLAKAITELKRNIIYQ